MSVLLSHIAREPFPERQNSQYLQYVDQSLEVLGAMEECHVASKIGDYAREFVAFLRNDSNGVDPSANEQHTTSSQFGGFPEINSFWSGCVPEFDMGFADSNFFDGNFAMLQAGMEDGYGTGMENMEHYDTNNMPV
jgi:hypothetical protein